MEKASSSQGSNDSNANGELNSRNFISEEMIKEEEFLVNAKREAEKLEIKDARTYEPDVDEKRFTCFKDLLKRSEAYTEFLKEKMVSQISMRKFEKSRKLSLMKHFRSEYLKKNIACDKYIKEEKVPKRDEDASSILEGNMLNAGGHVVSMMQPFSVENVTLRPYQIEGLSWLKVLFEFGINGILADEMGLGKTVQCISLIAHLYEMGVDGFYIVIGPLSTLSNWLLEFQRFAPKIPVILYHGNSATRKELRKKFVPVKFLDVKVPPVIITSYEVVMKDRPFLCHFQWRYLVVDEGHRLKNYKCRFIRELKKLKSSCRLLLTGTPLQNNLSELWSLMNFLLPEVFEDLESFESWFDCDGLMVSENCSKIIQQEREQQVLSNMHQILRPFLLRRLKSDVEINLPPKKEVIVYAPLTEIQKEYYRASLEKNLDKLLGAKEDEMEEDVMEPPRKLWKHDEEANGRSCRKYRTATMEEGLISGTHNKVTGSEKYGLRSSLPPSRKKLKIPSGKSILKMCNITMQLRKIVNHPYLVNFPMDPDSQELIINEELVSSCGKLLVLDAMLSKLHAKSHRVLIFSQMTALMDILEDYLQMRKYTYVRLDGKKGIEDRRVAIDAFSQNKTFVFLISTRAGGLGINLTAADTVIIYDSDWNPQIDLQAMDRCHRIGQTLPVVVYRLITAGTIDERIIDKAYAKKKLGIMVIEKGKFKEKKENVCGISIQELQDLLECSDQQMRIQPNGFVFSDSELEALLDRSDMVKREEDSSDKLASPIPKSGVKDHLKNIHKIKNKNLVIQKQPTAGSRVYKIMTS